ILDLAKDAPAVSRNLAHVFVSPGHYARVHRSVPQGLSINRFVAWALGVPALCLALSTLLPSHVDPLALLFTRTPLVGLLVTIGNPTEYRSGTTLPQFGRPYTSESTQYLVYPLHRTAAADTVNVRFIAFTWVLQQITLTRYPDHSTGPGEGTGIEKGYSFPIG